MAIALVGAGCGDGDEASTTTTASIATTVETTTPSSATIEMQIVSVFFGTGDGSDCGEVTAFDRQVPATADPVRAALDELVAGPTADEQNQGAGSFFSTESAGTVRSAALDKGLLVVDFDDFRRLLGNASSSCGSEQFLAELNSTVFQFPEVQRVRYEIEGSCFTFATWLQGDCVEFTRSGVTDPVDLPLIEKASRSGCTPETDQLAAGEWFGYLTDLSETEISFDLACWFEGAAADEAAEEDGRESPTLGGYYARNDSDDLRTIDVGPGTVVSWVPDPSDLSSFETVEYLVWYAARAERPFQPGVWLIIEAGDIVAIEEQFPDPVASLPGVIPACCYLPPTGANLTVSGVAHDDVLNVRVTPGADQPIALMLDPTEDEVSAVGRHRLLADSTTWYEIEVGGVTGWANSRFLSYLGPSYDVTSDIVDFAGDYPMASTMLELGAIVADIGANVLGDPTASTVLMTVAPSQGDDLAEVTFDVLGLGDDSVWGVRLHILGAPSESGQEITLKSVEATDLCLRSGSPDGLCV